MRLILLSDSLSFLEWRTADRRGLRSNDALTASMFCGGANCFNTTTFLLNSWAGLFKVVYPRLYGMSWRHFTVSMNPEFLAKIHVGRQRSYRCSYKMILRRKHAVHRSTTPFQTERYSRPRHLAASLTFPAHAKNRKTPLPNRPIHWRTLYFYIRYNHVHMAS